MSGKTNRTKGHNFERYLRRCLLTFFPKCETSRNESYTTDAAKIDLCNTGRWKIQAKNVNAKPNFKEILESIETSSDEDIRMLAFKWNKYKGPRGEFAVVYLSDFFRMLNLIENRIKENGQAKYS